MVRQTIGLACTTRNFHFNAKLERQTCEFPEALRKKFHQTLSQQYMEYLDKGEHVS